MVVNGCVRSMMVVAPGQRRRKGARNGLENALGASVQSCWTLHAQSPELAAMRHRGRCRGSTLGSGALVDPVLRVELMNINNCGNDTPASALPWEGRDSVQADAATTGWGKR